MMEKVINAYRTADSYSTRERHKIHILEEQEPRCARWVDLQPAGESDIFRLMDSLRAHVSLTSSIEIDICFRARKRDDWPCVRAIRMFLNDPLLAGHPFRFLWRMLLEGEYLYSPGIRLEIVSCDANSTSGMLAGSRHYPVDVAIEVLLAAGLIRKRSYGKRRENDSTAYYRIAHKDAHLGYLACIYFVDPSKGGAACPLVPTEKREWRGKSIPAWPGFSFAFSGFPLDEHEEQLENAEWQRGEFEPNPKIPSNTPTERPPAEPRPKIPKYRDGDIDPGDLVPEKLWMQ